MLLVIISVSYFLGFVDSKLDNSPKNEYTIDSISMDCNLQQKKTFVNLKTDPNLDRTLTWSLKLQPSGAIVASGGPYDKANKWYSHAMCLDQNVYEITLVGLGTFPFNVTSNEELLATNKWDDDFIVHNEKHTFEIIESEFECSEEDHNININLKTDAAPDKISYQIREWNSNLIYKDLGPFYLHDTLYSNKACLKTGAYTFVIKDTNGDGLSKSPEGWFNVSSKSTIMAGEGNFGTCASQKFELCAIDADCEKGDCSIDTCVENLCQSEIHSCELCGKSMKIVVDLHDGYTGVSWTLKEKFSKEIIQQGLHYACDDFIDTRTFCVPVGSYEFTMYDSDGIGKYEVSSDQAVIQQREGSTIGKCTPTVFQLCSSDADCEIDDCTASLCQNGICNTYLVSCEECGKRMEINVFTSVAYQRVSWQLIHVITGNVVQQEISYPCPSQNYDREFCISPGYYEFKIKDTHGIMNQYPTTFRVSLDNALLRNIKDWEYGYGEVLRFGICYDDGHCDDGDACTNDHCDTTTKSCQNIRDCNLCNLAKFNLTIETPNYQYINYVSFLSWDVKNAGTLEVVASHRAQFGLTYNANTVYEHEICLEDELFYDFTMSFNMEGDTTGWYKLSQDNKVHVEGDFNFKFFEVKRFSSKFCSSNADCDDGDPCTSDLCDVNYQICYFKRDCIACGKNNIQIMGSFSWRFFTGYFNTGYYGNGGAFNWQLRNEANVTVRSNLVELGTPYLPEDSLSPYSFCLDKGRYEFIISDFKNEDGSIKKYSYEIKSNNHIVGSGSNLYHIESLHKDLIVCSQDSDCDIDPCSYGTCDMDSNTCNLQLLYCEDCLPGYDPCNLENSQLDFCISSCGCGRIKVAVDVKTNNIQGQEILWSIKQLTGNETMMRGSQHNEIYHLYHFESCLLDDSYKFYLSGYKCETTKFGKPYNGLSYPGYIQVSVNDFLILDERAQPGTLYILDEIRGVICSNDGDCNDYNPCTWDSCDVQTKKCSFIPSFSLCRSHGIAKAMVLRVTANDAEPSMALKNISKAVFGIEHEDFSMSSQYSACSFNKFNITPFTGETVSGVSISDGVANLHLEMNIQGEQSSVIYNKIMLVAENVFGDLETQFDFLLLCLPPGTKIGESNTWKAYAFVSLFQSVYNDINCLYPSVLMHEIGHNLGLSHSNDKKNYGDETGMMGISYSIVDGPRKCFNPVKSWQLGWFYESHVELDFKAMPYDDDSSFTYFITGLSNYGNRQYEKSIIKMINTNDGLDYYFSWNTNSNFNTDTKEFLNEILVASRPIGYHYDDSNLIHGAESFTVKGVDEGVSIYFDSDIFSPFVEEIAFSISFMKTKNTVCQSNSDCEDGNNCNIKNCINNVCYVTEKSCADCGQNVTIEVDTNEFPTRLSWEVRSFDTDNVVFSSGYFLESFKYYESWKCLSYGMYTFSLTYENTTVTNSSAAFALQVGDIYIDYGNITEGLYVESVFIICLTDEDCYDYDGCSIDVCNQETKICNNTNVECRSCTFFSVNLTTDNFPEETDWTLFDTNIRNREVTSGNPFALDLFGVFGRRKAPTRSGRRKAPTKSGRRKAPTRSGRRKAPTRSGRRKAPTRSSSSHRNLQSVSRRALNEYDDFYDDDYEEIFDGDYIYEEICLHHNILYRFLITDEFGDGICCTEGAGGYVLSVDSHILKQGGSFGDSDELLFLFNNCTLDEDCEMADFSNSCSVAKCNIELSTCIYVEQSCADCGAMVSIRFKTDSYPTQSRWEVSREGKLILEGGEYVVKNEVFVTPPKCLSFGNYLFTIYDSNGDGIYGSDTSVYVNNTMVINTDGEFGAKFSSVFGICLEHSDCDDGDPCTNDLCKNKACYFEQVSCHSCGKRLLEVRFNTTFWPTSIYYNDKPSLYWVVSTANNDFVATGGPFWRDNFSYLYKKCLGVGDYVFTLPLYKFIASAELRELYGVSRMKMSYLYPFFDVYETPSSFEVLIDGEPIYLEANAMYSEEGDTMISFRVESFCSTDEHCAGQPCKKCNMDTGICRAGSEIGCSSCGGNYMVAGVFVDHWPYRYEWTLKRNNQVLFASEEQVKAGKIYVYDECLQPGTYTFTITDGFGMGMSNCLSNFCGYLLNLNDELLGYGTTFGEKGTINFSISCTDDIQCDDNDPCSIDRCDPEQHICMYEYISCNNCGGKLLTVDIRTDEELDGPFWHLVDTQHEVELKNKDYLGIEGDAYGYVFDKHEECVFPGKYVFQLIDVGNCNIGDCGYVILLDGQLLEEGIFDGESSNIPFDVNKPELCANDEMCDDNNPCTSDVCDLGNGICLHYDLACSICGGKMLKINIATDHSPYDVSWNISHSFTKKILLYARYTYTHIDSSFDYELCLHPGEYVFWIKDVWEDGFYGCHDEWSCGYSIFLDDEFFDGKIEFGEEYIDINIVSPTSAPSLPPSFLPSLSTFPSVSPFSAPSLKPSTELSLAPSNILIWMIEFDKIIHDEARASILDTISFKYKIPKNILENQLQVSMMSKDCMIEIQEDIATIERAIVREEFDNVDSGIVSITFNKSQIKESSLWESISNVLGELKMCIRTELLATDGEPVVFVDVIFKVKIDLLSSNFDLASVSLAQIEKDNVIGEEDIQVNACVCGLDLEKEKHICFSDDEKIQLEQNHIFMLCVYSSQNQFQVASFETVSLYQDGVAKFKACVDGATNGIAEVIQTGEVAVMELPLVTSFFKTKTPPPITIRGTVMLGLKSDRLLYENKVQFRNTGLSASSFEVVVYPKAFASLENSTYYMCLVGFLLVSSTVIFSVLHHLVKRKLIEYTPVQAYEGDDYAPGNGD